ncbi:WAP four-disulfide core domain protein 3-like [Liolophura sinensis]|uniref:WAP four-disulfide core domain protein 3-like n=1 Tax=Liolophura sinensis TaxID=3198878 RepID=UPI003159353F
MPPAISKDGYCPASTTNLQCDEPCTSDGSCSGNKKCCQLSCGMSCVDPNANHPGVKLGFCPFVNPNVSTMCLQTCSSDYSCAGDTKCCSFGQCSMRCMAPEAAPQAQRKTGDCPSSQDARGRPDTIQCISDYACPGAEKCCRIGNAVQCSAPAQDSAMKDGACPALTSTSPVCIRRCSSDSNCPGNQKCCAAGCSSQCAAPSFSDAPRLNPGHCPYVEPHVLLPCTVNCTADSECGTDMKCCEYGCGMRCLRSQPFPPTTQKDGSCPSQPAVNPLYVVPNGRFWFKTKEIPSRETFGYRNCRNDGQCPGTLKCCASSVGGTECITPV